MRRIIYIMDFFSWIHDLHPNHYYHLLMNWSFLCLNVQRCPEGTLIGIRCKIRIAFESCRIQISIRILQNTTFIRILQILNSNSIRIQDLHSNSDPEFEFRIWELAMYFALSTVKCSLPTRTQAFFWHCTTIHVSLLYVMYKMF